MVENNEIQKNKVKTIVIVLLIIVIVLLGAVCVYLSLNQNKTASNNNNNDLQEQPTVDYKEEHVAMTIVEQEKFMNNFIEKLDLINLTVQPFKPSDLSNQDKLQIAFTVGELKNQTVSYNTVLSVFQKLFGNKVSIDKTNYNCPFNQSSVYYNYNSSNDTYNYVELSCGGGLPFSDVVNRFEEGTIYKVDGEITSAVVKVRKSFSTDLDVLFVNDRLVRYGTFQDAHNGTNAVDDFNGDYNDTNFSKFTDDYFIKGMEDNLDDYPVHTYTFGYENGAYYLQSLTIE